MEIIVALIIGAGLALLFKGKISNKQLEKTQEKAKEIEQDLNTIEERIKDTKEYHENLENPSDIIDFWNNRKR